MQADRDYIPAPRPRDLSRWVICVGLALAAHAAGATALIAPWGKPYDEVASAPVIVVELTAVAVARSSEPTDVAPGPGVDTPEDLARVRAVFAAGPPD